MHARAHAHHPIVSAAWNPSHIALTIVLTLLFLIFLFLFLTMTAQPAQGQTYSIIHTFTGGDGADPFAGLTMDSAGNFYGTVGLGGYVGGVCAPNGCGEVFKLSRKGSGWVLDRIYSFTGGDDGIEPGSRVIFGPDGALYGTTGGGGAGCGGSGCGTVFKLVRPTGACATVQRPWTETVIHRFTGNDGQAPAGDLVFDTAGNIYGVTSYGGTAGGGTVYQLTPSGGGWTLSVLHNFGYSNDGATAGSGVILDAAGNLYGATTWGGTGGWGMVYQLTPSGSGWTENVLHNFAGGEDGWGPFGVVFDGSGNLFGTTVWGDPYGSEGTVYEMTRGSWNYSVVYHFARGYYGPFAALTLDSAGNFYGTLPGGVGNGKGAVFKLTNAHGSWSYTSLHDFNGSDGFYPMGNVTIDANGNFYGTTAYGADYCWEQSEYGCGVVWEITP